MMGLQLRKLSWHFPRIKRWVGSAHQKRYILLPLLTLYANPCKCQSPSALLSSLSVIIYCHHQLLVFIIWIWIVITIIIVNVMIPSWHIPTIIIIMLITHQDTSSLLDWVAELDYLMHSTLKQLPDAVDAARSSPSSSSSSPSSSTASLPSSLHPCKIVITIQGFDCRE